MVAIEAPEYPEKVDGAVLKVAGVVVLAAIMSIVPAPAWATEPALWAA